MKQYIAVVISLFCWNFYAQKGDPVKLDYSEVTKKTDDLVNAYIDLGIFSGVVVIADKGKPFYEQSFGLADREKGIPNTLETKFVIGSMNKTFTRILILQLMEEGKLALSDQMVKYLKGFDQPDAPKITINHLLNHTSGFGDYHSPELFDLPYQKKNIQGILPLIKKLELNFEPGTDNEYSNAGYIILGAIIEKITGKSYAENVTERIAKPMEMKSLVTTNVKQIPDRAIGYMKTFDGYIDNEEFISEPRSDGGFYANVYDILKFYRAYFYGDELLNDKQRKQDEFFQRIAGICEEHGAGIPLAGGFNGANTVHVEMLADDISIVVFANMDEPVAEKIAIGILHIINGKIPEEPALPAKLNVYKTYKDKGINYVKEHFEELTTNWFFGDPKDFILNNLGYDLLFSGQLEEAIDIFKLNTELYPEIANCWDSYGEALLESGDRNGALKAYKKALEINPDLPSTRKAVKELEK